MLKKQNLHFSASSGSSHILGHEVPSMINAQSGNRQTGTMAMDTREQSYKQESKAADTRHHYQTNPTPLQDAPKSKDSPQSFGLSKQGFLVLIAGIAAVYYFRDSLGLMGRQQ